jgi:hypothetical protein
VFPPVFDVAVRLAERFRVPVIRVPFERTVADLPLCVRAHRNYGLVEHG